jgi:hypothetical protein
MKCDSCGRKCGTGPADHVHELWKLGPDTRSGLKRALFSRNPTEYGGDYEKMWVCSECAGRLRSQGWEQHCEGED